MDIDWKSTGLQDKATDNELGALRAAMGCITDYNLESQVPPMGIEIRIAELEKLKAERRRSLSALGFTVEPNDPNGGKHGICVSLRKQQVQWQNENKRARTAVPTVRPYDTPACASTVPSRNPPSWHCGTSDVVNGGPGRFGFAGSSTIPPSWQCGTSNIFNGGPGRFAFAGNSSTNPPPWQHGTRNVFNGGPGRFPFAGDSATNNLGAWRGSAGNHYLYHF